MPELPQRFWDKVDKNGPIPAHMPELGPCWLWTACCDKDGYAYFRWQGRMRYAYHLHWEVEVSTVPTGYQLDHKCLNRKCVNIAHLQLATYSTNGQNRVGADTDSRSGVRGVVWHKQSQKWEARAKYLGKRHYGGLHDTIEGAEQAAIALRNKLMTNNLVDRRVDT